MTNDKQKRLPKITNSIQIEHLYDEDGIHTVGYYALGFWDKRSVAIATNQAYGIEPGLEASDFEHLYIRRLIASIEIAKYEIVISSSKDTRAMKSTYCQLG